MKDARTRAIRDAQGHSLGSGVGADVLPIVEDVYYHGHATTRSAVEQILATGLNRQQRLHVHFYECNRYGHLHRGAVSRQAEVILVISASHARSEGIVFHRSSNDVILSAWLDGVIAPKYFRYVYQLPRLNPIWQRQVEEEEGDHGPIPNGLIPSQCGFDPWFDQEDLFEESEEGKLPNDAPESGTEVMPTRPEHHSAASTLALTPRRVPVNPVFLRPRGSSPVSDSEEENGSVVRREVQTAASVVTRAVDTARTSECRNQQVKQEEVCSPQPSVITRTA